MRTYGIIGIRGIHNYYGVACLDVSALLRDFLILCVCVWVTLAERP